MDSDADVSIDAARRAAEAGELGSFVADFLATPGSDNAQLGRELADEVVAWRGPVRLPFDLLNRLAGPADQPTLGRLGDDDIDTVEAMRESVHDDDWEPAPLVVTFDGDHLELEDGNHRVEALRRAGHDAYWSVIGFRSEDAQESYDASCEV